METEEYNESRKREKATEKLDEIQQQNSLAKIFLGFFLLLLSISFVAFLVGVNGLAVGLFVIVLLGAVLSEKDNIILYFSQAGLITLFLNILMMIIAFYIAKIFISGTSQRKTIVVECGLQNGTLAIVVATSVFGGGVYLIPAATYSLIMFASSLIYIYFARRS